MTAAALRFDGIGKTFPGVKALDGISFTAQPGQVHALMGENGAGKSTLLKILGGAYIPSSGALHIGAQTLAFKCAADSIASGVAVIHQELHLVPEMSVAENLFLGHLPTRWGVVNRGLLRKQALACLKGLADEIDPDQKLGRLSLGQRQLVEIAKALSRGAHVIAFDEPTSSLSAREIERLMAIITRLRDEGKVVLYVSHRMEEVFRICDAVTVFKDGRYVRTFEDMSALTHDQLVTCMVGRDIQDIYDYRPREHGEVALKVDGLLGPGLREPVSFQVRKGEILGLFGLVGAGRTELFRLLSGLERASAVPAPAAWRWRVSHCSCARRATPSPPGCCCAPKTAKRKASSRCPAWPKTSTSVLVAPTRGSAGCCARAGKRATPRTRSRR